VIRRVRQEVQRDDGERAEDDRTRQRAARIGDFAGDEADVGEAIVGPQDAYQRETDRAGR
jgi:hypothetical protein